MGGGGVLETRGGQWRNRILGWRVGRRMSTCDKGRRREGEGEEKGRRVVLETRGGQWRNRILGG